MTIAGLVRTILDETDNGRLLTAAYRTSLNHIDRLLGLKWVSKLSAKDIKDLAQSRRDGATELKDYPVAIDIDGAKPDQKTTVLAAPATISLDIMHSETCSRPVVPASICPRRTRRSRTRARNCRSCDGSGNRER